MFAQIVCPALAGLLGLSASILSNAVRPAKGALPAPVCTDTVTCTGTYSSTVTVGSASVTFSNVQQNTSKCNCYTPEGGSQCR